MSGHLWQIKKTTPSKVPEHLFWPWKTLNKWSNFVRRQWRHWHGVLSIDHPSGVIQDHLGRRLTTGDNLPWHRKHVQRCPVTSPAAGWQQPEVDVGNGHVRDAGAATSLQWSYTFALFVSFALCKIISAVTREIGLAAISKNVGPVPTSFCGCPSAQLQP